MPGGYSIIAIRHLWLAGVVVILLSMTYGGIPRSAAANPAEPILQLTPDKNRYFLGPYLTYLEDPQKKLTIEDVSSPQMTTRFVKHAGKIINLGLDSSAYWIRFTVILAAKWIVMGIFSDWNSPGPGIVVEFHFLHIFLEQFIRQKLFNH